MKISRKTTIISVIVALAISGGVWAFGQSKSPNTPAPTPSSASNPSAHQSTGTSSPSSTQSTDNTAPAEQSNSPSGSQGAQSSDTVLVATGYGTHDPSMKLQEDQTTSTTCTAQAYTSCQIIFTNSSTGKVVQFNAKTTDGQGVANWDWQGSDVGSGTWQVKAVAGDLQSASTETLYIQ